MIGGFRSISFVSVSQWVRCSVWGNHRLVYFENFSDLSLFLSLGRIKQCLPSSLDKHSTNAIGISFAILEQSRFILSWTSTLHCNRPLALRGHVTNASFNTMSWNLADAKN